MRVIINAEIIVNYVDNSIKEAAFSLEGDLLGVCSIFRMKD